MGDTLFCYKTLDTAISRNSKTACSCKHNDNIVKLCELDPLNDIPDSV